METSPTSNLNLCEHAIWSKQCRPILLSVGASALMVSRSGSVHPFATRRAFAFVPSGASFHVNIQRIAMILFIGTPARRTILNTEFEIHWSTSLSLAASINVRSSGVRCLRLTSAFLLASEMMNDKWRWISSSVVDGD